MKLDFVFVCQSGPIEIQACVLAASLRKYGPRDACLHVLEPVPAQDYGTLSAPVRDFLTGLDARCYQFENPISSEYKIGNKLNAFRVPAKGDRIVFMDSDTVLLGPFVGYEEWFDRQFAAVAAMDHVFPGVDNREWVKAYALCGAPPPQLAWPSRKTLQWGLPYFNAGFIVTDPAVAFSDTWIDVCQQIWASDEITNKTPWLDQLAIPIVIALKRLTTRRLSQKFNYLLSQGLHWKTPPLVGHYLSPRFLSATHWIRNQVLDLVAEYHLEEILEADAEWRKLGQRRRAANPLLASLQLPVRPLPPTIDRSLETAHGLTKRTSLGRLVRRLPFGSTLIQRIGDARKQRSGRLHTNLPLVFLTGIPGAGVGVVRDTLARQPGVAVLHDFPVPKRPWREDHSPLADSSRGTVSDWARRRFPAFAREFRRRARVCLGALETATRGLGGRQPFDCQVGVGTWQARLSGTAGEDGRIHRLVLTNALDFLLCQPELRQLFPDARIVNIIRNPTDTIRAWARRPRLWDVDVDGLFWDGVAESLQAEWFFNRSLTHLRRVTDPAQRRAGFWCMLAALGLTDDALSFRLDFDALQQNPDSALEALGIDVSPRPEAAASEALVSVDVADAALTPHELECIRTICIDESWRFGYDLGSTARIRPEV